MKRKSLLILLLLAAFAPWTTAQAQETLTVYENATGINQYVPVYGSWADAYLKCEFIIPASELTTMNGGEISQMAFAVTVPAEAAWTGTFQVFLKEVSETTLSAWSGTENATIVYEGTVDGTTNPMTVTFNNNYTYEGGNLLVGFYQTVEGNWEGISFKGQSVTGASGSYYNSNSLNNVSFTQRDFIPTTTFTYEPAQEGDCDKPETLVAEALSSETATLNWGGGSGTYNVEIKGGSYTDWSPLLSNTTEMTTMVENLTPNTAYQVRVQSVCDGTTPTSGYKTANFTTPMCDDMCEINYAFSNGSFSSWFNAAIKVVDVASSNVLATWTGNASGTLNVCHGQQIRFEWQSGSYDNYSGVIGSYTITDFLGEEILSGSGSPLAAPVLYTVSCTPPACPPPTNLDVTDGSVTASQATVTWDGTSQSYVVMIGEESIVTQADFETGDLSQANFTTTTSYPFTVVANTHSGAYCAKSGNGGINSSTSDMELEVTLAQDATLTFSAKVSSEGNYDKAYFSIDGTAQSDLNGISGAGSWIDYTYPLTAGTHTLRWYYTKDSSQQANDDCFYVDDIVIKAVNSWTEYTTANPTYTFENLTPGTDYQVKVKGNCGDDGYSAEAGPVSFTTLENCPKPTGLAVTTNGETATATWTGTATDYNIDINGTVYNNVTSPYEFDVELSTTYNVKVQANCDGETSDWTDPVSITTPACIGGRIIEYTLTDHYNDSWNGASITVIEGCDILTTITCANGASPFTGTLELCGDYYEFIWNKGNYDSECGFTFTEGGTTLFTKPSTLSDGLVLYTIGEQSCVTPTGLTVGTPEKRSVELSWTSEGEAWQICLNDDETNLIDVTENPYVLEGLDPETTYSVKIRTNCGDKQSCWTDNESFTTQESCLPVGTLAEATEVKSTSAKLTWALTDDTQTLWEVAYKTDADADFTNVDATTNNGFLLEDLTAETEYTVKVRANCGSEDGYSVWSNEITFTTAEACMKPAEITASNITSVSADLTWTGESDEYNVMYREVITAGADINVTYDFEDGTQQGWTTIDADGYGNAWSVNNASNYAYNSNYSMKATYNSDYAHQDYLVSPQIPLGGTFSFYTRRNSNSGNDTFRVYLSTTGNTDASDFDIELTNGDVLPTLVFNQYTYDLSSYSGNGYVAIVYTAPADQYWLYIDDINYVYTAEGEYGEWQDATSDTEALTLEGLNSGKTYQVKVQGVCEGVESAWSNVYEFTTMDEGTKVFVAEGNWNEDANWIPQGAPALTDNVIIRANATIPTGCVALANGITIEGENTLTINDGGQLLHNTDDLVATMQKNVAPYEDETGIDNYILLASPIEDATSPTDVENMISSTQPYDLYKFDQNPTPEDNGEIYEWRNYKANPFDLILGEGYLYAHNYGATTTLSFTGVLRNNAVTKMFELHNEGTNWAGWNLIGNPFSCNATVHNSPQSSATYNYYKIGADGEWQAASGAVAPMEGIFVSVENFGTAEYAYFTRVVPENSTAPTDGILNVNLMANEAASRKGNSRIDMARLRFGQGNNLGKLNLFGTNATVFFPQNGKDYGVMYAEAQGEMPLHFKAEKNGSYTLGFTTEDVEFSYLHLIDNLTGTDVDLLATPSYSFDARTTDYASRFRLVFATGSSAEGDSFGFINAAGNFCVFGIEGEATLQVIDLTGRILSSEGFSGSYEKPINAATGVYMVRLINGNDVKTQKVVVR